MARAVPRTARVLVSTLVLGLFVTAVVAPQVAAADPPGSGFAPCDVQTYPIPDGNSARTLTTGPDGALWFPIRDSENYDTDIIGRLDPVTGAFTSVTVSAAGRVLRLATGPDGAIWMTATGGTHGDSIARFDPSTGESTDYPTPTADAYPNFITPGPDGAMWFTESGAAQIGRVDPSTGVVTEYALPSPSSSSPIGIVAGPDGNLWVTDSGNNSVVRFDPSSGATKAYPLPIGSNAEGLEGSDPGQIIVGFDGAVWFSQDYAQSIGRIDPLSGHITEYSAGVTPVSIANGPDAAIWFSDTLGEGIGRLDSAAGTVAECSVGHLTDPPFDITAGPDGNLWFAETAVGDGGVTAIERIVVPRTLSATGSFVTAAYCDFLGRAPSADERSAAAARLDSGGESKPAFLTELAVSPAWINRIVAGFYHDTLGRDPDSGGLAFWTNEIARGRRTVAQVAAAFYASDEYYSGIGGGTNTTWVTDLYTKILHRAPDHAGLAFWVEQVPVRGRTWVAFNLYQSQESGSDRVTRLYETLLHRKPDAAGLQFWTGQVLSQGDLVLAVDLAASDEYAADAVTRFR